MKNEKIKERLAFLRGCFYSLIAIMVSLVGTLASSFRVGNIDNLFWVGYITLNIIIFMKVIVYLKIKDLNDKMEE